MRSGQEPVNRTAIAVLHRGFTLFEFILVIIVIAVSAGVFFNRFLTYQESAEKVAMEQTAGAVRSALTIQVSGMLARGRTEEIARLAAINPMTLLAELPKNYAGEFYGAADNVAVGNWYFDMKTRQLIYLVRHHTHFQSDGQGDKAVRYQVSVVFNNAMRGGDAKAASKEIGGIVLKEVQPYTWNVRQAQ